MVIRDGGRIDHEGTLGLLKLLWDQFGVVFVVYLGALLDKLFGQMARLSVVAGNGYLHLEKIAHYGTHADASGTYKVYCLNVFKLHGCKICLILLLMLTGLVCSFQFEV